MTIEKEQDGALSLPFAELPTGVYIKGPEYAVTFDRICRYENGDVPVTPVVQQVKIDFEGGRDES